MFDKNNTVNPNLVPKTCIAKGDSGASSHFWRPQDEHVLTDIATEEGPPIKLPNATTINDNKIGHLPIPELSKKATKTRILSELKSASLVSIPQLTDDGCTAEIDDKKLKVSKMIRLF